MRRRGWNILCIVFVVATIAVIIWSGVNGCQRTEETYADGIDQLDLDEIHLENSGVEVDFSDVILSGAEETRKLIVSEQEGTVSTELTDKIIEKLDFDFLKKTQSVSYAGTGYFVVDLDQFTRDDVVVDEENRIVTIKIGHAYLQAIEIDPDNIMIDEVREGLLARGDIKLTVQDYSTIEKEIRTRLEEKFNTAENGQEADEMALEMVREVYEPIVRAIDGRYSVAVEFK